MSRINNESVKKQIKINIFFVFILDIIFYIIICLLKKCYLSVILGISFGSLCSVTNFILIAISMEKLVFIPVYKVKKVAIFHYAFRYVILGLSIFFASFLNKFNLIDMVSFFISLFFSKLAIFIQVFLEW